MNYYIVDLHLGHKNIISLCVRPFDSITAMDAVLIENWNAKLRKTDDVYILGDLFYRNVTPAKETLIQLKGRKHLLVGNHDQHWIKTVDLPNYFVEVANLLTFKRNCVKYTLCPYPMLSWDGHDKGGYMIHGHTHGELPLP
jgi:calcineurin-like phosphoesterase family protein